ncbi:MAG: hypothetical protein JO110_28155, partial [Acetobacteraceae bacterium]|nr:hypothetical protein [Acetobacteraceae bacterium]
MAATKLVVEDLKHIGAKILRTIPPRGFGPLGLGVARAPETIVASMPFEQGELLRQQAAAPGAAVIIEPNSPLTYGPIKPLFDRTLSQMVSE